MASYSSFKTQHKCYILKSVLLDNSTLVFPYMCPVFFTLIELNFEKFLIDLFS